LSGAVERLYVHSPDRLARKYAYQVLLVEEFQRLGVEVVFLNRPLGQSPEDDLLLQVQGMMAEYERAKIIERYRRGKLHAARCGSVNVLRSDSHGQNGLGPQRDLGHAEKSRLSGPGRLWQDTPRPAAFSAAGATGQAPPTAPDHRRL
jgi:site-specific DNA recombinase